MLHRLKALLLVFFLVGSSSQAQGQGTEERFHDLFVTAGYCTAFGAAVGASLLAFTDEPADNLRYVAMGASLGFLGGSILGTYVIFTPGLVENSDYQNAPGLLTRSAPLPHGHLALRPTWDKSRNTVTSVEGAMTLWTF